MTWKKEREQQSNVKKVGRKKEVTQKKSVLDPSDVCHFRSIKKSKSAVTRLGAKEGALCLLLLLLWTSWERRISSLDEESRRGVWEERSKAFLRPYDAVSSNYTASYITAL